MKDKVFERFKEMVKNEFGVSVIKANGPTKSSQMLIDELNTEIQILEKMHAEKSCLICARMFHKRDEFWDNEAVCICGKDNHYIGYPDEAAHEACPSYEAAVDQIWEKGNRFYEKDT